MVVLLVVPLILFKSLGATVWSWTIVLYYSSANEQNCVKVHSADSPGQRVDAYYDKIYVRIMKLRNVLKDSIDFKFALLKTHNIPSF